RFLAGRTSRHPDAYRRVRGFVLQNLGEDAVFERLESLRLAEKARDVDQDVLIQRLELRAILLQVPCVIAEIFLDIKHHAPHDSPPDRRIAITAEVDAERRAQQLQDITQARFFGDRQYSVGRARSCD